MCVLFHSECLYNPISLYWIVFSQSESLSIPDPTQRQHLQHGYILSLVLSKYLPNLSKLEWSNTGLDDFHQFVVSGTTYIALSLCYISSK